MTRMEYSAFANACPLQTDTFLFPLIHSHNMEVIEASSRHLHDALENNVARPPSEFGSKFVWKVRIKISMGAVLHIVLKLEIYTDF